MYFNIRHTLEDPKWKNLAKPYRDTLKSSTFLYEINTSLKQDLRTRYQDFYKNSHNSSTSYWNMNPLATNYGTIRGYVTENSKALGNCFVYLYQKSNGAFVSYAITSEEGFFEITALAHDVQYFIVAVYPERKYNAVVLDDVRIDSRKEYNINVG